MTLIALDNSADTCCLKHYIWLSFTFLKSLLPSLILLDHSSPALTLFGPSMTHTYISGSEACNTVLPQFLIGPESKWSSMIDYETGGEYSYSENSLDLEGWTINSCCKAIMYKLYVVKEHRYIQSFQRSKAEQLTRKEPLQCLFLLISIFWNCYNTKTFSSNPITLILTKDFSSTSFLLHNWRKNDRIY